MKNKSIDATLENTDDFNMDDFDELRGWIDAEFEAHADNDNVSLPTKSNTSLPVDSPAVSSYCKQTKRIIPETITMDEVPNRNASFVSTEKVPSLSKGRHFLDLGTSPSTDSLPANTGKVMNKSYGFMNHFDDTITWFDCASNINGTADTKISSGCKQSTHNIPKIIEMDEDELFVSTEEASSLSKGGHFLDLGTSPSSGSVPPNSGKVTNGSSDSMEDYDGIIEWFEKENFCESSMPQIILKHEACAPFVDKAKPKSESDYFPITTHSCALSTNETPGIASDVAPIMPTLIEIEKQENSDLSSRQLSASDEMTKVHLNNLASSMKKSQLSRMLLAQMNISGVRSNRSLTKKGQKKRGTSCMDYIIQGGMAA